MPFPMLTRKPTFADAMPALRILIAPSGFKESLGADDVADCIEEGIKGAAGDHTYIQKLPLHDGGEGFSKALTKHYGGVVVEKEVTGPVGTAVLSYYGRYGPDLKTAAIDMAAAAGLRLVPRDLRDPCRTTTYGVGELIAAALDDGCTRIIIGCGDSGTSDGGAGMLQALGVRLLDGVGIELPKAGGGIDLSDLESMDLESIHPRLRHDAIGMLLLAF
jgi:glycerate kinase